MKSKRMLHNPKILEYLNRLSDVLYLLPGTKKKGKHKAEASAAIPEFPLPASESFPICIFVDNQREFYVEPNI
jgi:hypothetical protein